MREPKVIVCYAADIVEGIVTFSSKLELITEVQDTATSSIKHKILSFNVLSPVNVDAGTYTFFGLISITTFSVPAKAVNLNFNNPYSSVVLYINISS